MKLVEKLWLWGHGRQCDNIKGQKVNFRGRPGISCVSTAEAARIMGISNICRIVVEPAEQPPYDEEIEEAADMRQIVWSILGSGVMDSRNDLEEVIRLAKKYPNIVGGIMDDFFPGANNQKAKIYTPEVLRDFRKKLHNEAGRELDLWIVVYNWDVNYETNPYFDFDYKNFQVKPYLDECDVATLWMYDAEELPKLEETYTKMRAVWGYDRPLYAGCYMWNFPKAKPISRELMELQLDTYYQWLKEGKIEGIIFCHNYLVDLDIDAIYQVKEWINRHSDEIL